MKIVYLEWVDSAAFLGWHPPGKDNIPSRIVSIGWLVQEDKKSVTISTSRSEFGNFTDAITIPKVAILKQRKIKPIEF